MMEEGGAALIMSSNNGHRGCRVLPPFGKSPVLLAATFPWDRDSEIATTVVPPRNQDTNNRAAMNEPRLRDQWRDGVEYGGSDTLLQELLMGVLGWGTMNTTLWKKEAEHGEKERRVAALCKVTNEVGHWKSWLPLMGQWQAQILQPAFNNNRLLIYPNSITTFVEGLLEPTKNYLFEILSIEKDGYDFCYDGGKY
ncbi:hypothetical protein PIB30_080998 [Stylosanthes scabra]|uniref:Uncharacterized protein n=1 Tax=Stylosanthes scabra TaxID=79078 RepID=A0ABU6XR10_9FABA|nr:hypothetical protein [Stylosanthes scabra]